MYRRYNLASQSSKAKVERKAKGGHELLQSSQILSPHPKLPHCDTTTLNALGRCSRTAVVTKTLVELAKT